LRSFVSNPNRNIIALYKVFRFEGIGNELLVLEYCNGGSLHNCLNNYIIKNGKPFPEDLVRYLMKQILNGVKSLHEKGIIHRDLKLNNILLKYSNGNDLINRNIYAA
jgi:serine/threonine protein kinase